ncbi:MAG: hypothetical protein R2710_26925 [Acidimicrobiales bacterium]
MTQTDVRMAWGKVGDRLSSLGLKLKLHAEQEFADDDEVTGALDRLAEAIDDAVDMLTNAATDEAVQARRCGAGRHFIDAVATTVNQATSQLRSKA